MRKFTPEDWYWLADDGRVFASARFAMIGKDDAGLVAWSEAGAEHRPDGEPWPPTAWPRDDNSAQTLAALDAVLRGYGLSTTGPVRTVTTYQLMSALTDTQRTAYANAKPWDQRLFSARDTPWPEANEKIARIATVLGTTPKAWFDAALNSAAG